MLFISLEGGEGAGKTTQAARLVERIESTGLRCLRVREPGSTSLGTDLRKLIKRSNTSDEVMSRASELFLFAAARSELVTKVIGPQRDDPDLVVVADRYADSTVAYQGYGRGIEIETIRAVNALATHGIMPDLTILLDCPPEVGISRVRGLQLQMPLDATKNADTLNRDAEGMKFEEESEEFHVRIRHGFHALADQDPDRWRIVDATKSVDAISDDIWNAVQGKLPVPAGA